MAALAAMLASGPGVSAGACAETCCESGDSALRRRYALASRTLAASNRTVAALRDALRVRDERHQEAEVRAPRCSPASARACAELPDVPIPA